MTPTEAHDIWYKATIEPNKRVNTIIQSIIDDCKRKGMPGLAVVINRNPGNLGAWVESLMFVHQESVWDTLTPNSLAFIG